MQHKLSRVFPDDSQSEMILNNAYCQATNQSAVPEFWWNSRELEHDWLATALRRRPFSAWSKEIGDVCTQANAKRIVWESLQENWYFELGTEVDAFLFQVVSLSWTERHLMLKDVGSMGPLLLWGMTFGTSPFIMWWSVQSGENLGLLLKDLKWRMFMRVRAHCIRHKL